MTEGSLYDPELAARAILQAQGDVLEAITLVRSYRTTLPRFGYTLPVNTAGLPPQRRISATFKDLPGGQQLGATFDYTHRLFTDAATAGRPAYARDDRRPTAPAGADAARDRPARRERAHRARPRTRRRRTRSPATSPGSPPSSR